MLHCAWCGTRWIARPYTENPYRRLACRRRARRSVGRHRHRAYRAGARTIVRQRRAPAAQPPSPSADRRWLKGLAISARRGRGLLRAARAAGRGAAGEARCRPRRSQLAFQRVHSETTERNGVTHAGGRGRTGQHLGGRRRRARHPRLAALAGGRRGLFVAGRADQGGARAGRLDRLPQRRVGAAGRRQPGHLRLAQRENQIVGMR